MITCKLMLCARGVIRDVATETISAYSILESISPIGFPILIQDFNVLLFLTREKRDPANIEFNLHLRIDGEDMGPPLQVKADFQDKSKNRCIVKIEGLFIAKPGTFSVDAHYGNKKLSSFEMEVAPAPPHVMASQDSVEPTTRKQLVKFRRRKNKIGVRS